MFAVDHAATALLIKRRFPFVPLAPLLVSVQAMELAWVGLNYFGVERTTTEVMVRSVSDIHLAYMPYSHSVATAVIGAVLAWFGRRKGARSATVGPSDGRRYRVAPDPRPVDTCTRHCAVAGQHTSGNRIGLYDHAPMWGFALEIAYGAVCWRVYRGSRSLLALIALGNLANITLFSAAVHGPEQYMAGHP